MYLQGVIWGLLNARRELSQHIGNAEGAFPSIGIN